MLSQSRLYGLAVVSGVALATSSGCNGNKPEKPEAGHHDSHGHHSEHGEDMPETFVAAVNDIKEHAPEIKAAFVEGKPEEVHDALHHLGEIFESMNDLIDASDLTDEQKAQAKEASEALFDQYTRLDTEVLHEGSTELKYEDVESKIEEELAKLEALAGNAEHTDHDESESP